MPSPQIEHFPRAMIFKWLLMAVIAGSVNAGGYLSCRSFVTHVTGFATLFGVDLASGDVRAAVGILSVPFFFLIGVVVATLLTDEALVRGGVPRYGVVMGLVSALLLAVALCGHFDVFGIFGTALILERDYFLLAMLCAASGLQNAAISIASSSVMRSTHLTGLTTDIGIGLVRAFFGRSGRVARRVELYRSWLRFGTIACFAAGAAIGAALFIQVQYLGFLLPCVLSIYVGNLGARAVDRGGGAPGVAPAADERHAG